METLKYCKVREVKSPVRAHPTDAGIDFFVPENISPEDFFQKCDVTGDQVQVYIDNDCITSMTIKPGQSVLIPSGIKVKVPDGMMLQFVNKSGIAAKKHLLVGSSVVDVGYEGECHINLHNAGTENVTINAGDKIVQGILIPVSFMQTEELTDEKSLYSGERSSRGAGGFGSSGTK